MILVATKKISGDFFRAQTIGVQEVNNTKQTMQNDAEEELNFQTIVDDEYNTTQ